ncbi:hypothetical protein [Methylobacterium sp. SD21]|uniref:hypothetical protein n=1 Tax=Methylobacterium litchii TaxID=3138810 RepID=UPI00313B33F9
MPLQVRLHFGSACQATELRRIRCHALGLDLVTADAAGKPAPHKSAPSTGSIFDF